MTRPSSIRAKGLEKHLNDTKTVHNNRGYAQFVKYVTEGDEFGERIPVLKLARLFNTTYNTTVKWLTIYHEEQEHGLPKH